MKRVKITEEQYEILNNFLVEAKNPYFDKQIKQKKVDAKQQAGVEKQKANNIPSTKPVDLKPTNTNSIQSKIETMNQTLNSLNVNDTFNFLSDNKKYKGEINKKDTTETYISLFDIEKEEWSVNLEIPTTPFVNNSGKIALVVRLLSGQQQSLMNISGFNVKKALIPEPSDSKKETPKEPAEDTKTPEEDTKTQAKQSDSEVHDDSQLVYTLILKDPKLRDAFWSQPKLLGLIKSGNPVGIGPAQDLINQYKSGGGFKNNKKIIITIVKGDGAVLLPNKKYTGTTKLDNNNNKYIIINNINSKNYYLYFKDSDTENGNIIGILRPSNSQDIISKNIEFKFSS